MRICSGLPVPFCVNTPRELCTSSVIELHTSQRLGLMLTEQEGTWLFSHKFAYACFDRHFPKSRFECNLFFSPCLVVLVIFFRSHSAFLEGCIVALAMVSHYNSQYVGLIKRWWNKNVLMPSQFYILTRVSTGAFSSFRLNALSFSLRSCM